MRDLHNNITVVHAITPQAVGTSGSSGGKTSAAIDRTGYRSVEFIFSAGAAASADDTADSGLGRPNAALRIELESNRSGVISLQKHSIAFERAGYGLSYDKYYGGI